MIATAILSVAGTQVTALMETMSLLMETMSLFHKPMPRPPFLARLTHMRICTTERATWSGVGLLLGLASKRACRQSF
jgi:hypothetical protein